MLLGIIQARMASSRFPGKVLEDLSGKPMLWHVVDRVRRSRRIDEVVVATSVNPSDVPIVEFLVAHQIPYFRGDEDDVLDRFYQAARVFGGDGIVRFCGDSPLTDDLVIDQVIDFASAGEFDYVNNWRTFPEGLHVEVFSSERLKEAWEGASKPSEREHVTPFFYNNPDRFRLGYCDSAVDLPPMRLVVDYPQDLELVRRVHERLSDDSVFHLDQICDLYEREPTLFDINGDVPRLEGYRRSLERDREAAHESRSDDDAGVA